MKKYILILTQALKNKSIDLLIEAMKKNPGFKDYTVIVWQVDQVYLTSSHVQLKSTKSDYLIPSIAINEIALVIKRTWGPIREKALLICERLENKGVTVLNGCAFISWSHSKIGQYRTAPLIFPKTICFDKEFIQSIQYNDSIFIEKILAACQENKIFPPFVLKKDKGCRADGVYLIESYTSLKEFIIFMLNKNNENNEFLKGFLLQEWIHSHPCQDISDYYRINIVEGVPQSAVRFQLKWCKSQGDTFYKKLVEFEEEDEMPVDLGFFPSIPLGAILNACPCKNGVIGVDVILNPKGEMYLLEYNDGPNISEIVELGYRYQKKLIWAEAAKACRDFPVRIAQACLTYALQSNKQQEPKIVAKL